MHHAHLAERDSHRSEQATSTCGLVGSMHAEITQSHSQRSESNPHAEVDRDRGEDDAATINIRDCDQKSENVAVHCR